MNEMTDPARAADGAPPELIAGTSFIGVPLVLTAMRCTLQYIVVPLVLPIFSIGGAFSPLVNIAVGALGVGVIGYNLTRLWRTNWRWRYLGLSLIVIPIILATMYFDYTAFLVGGAQ
ncbi:MAG: hypothetical protein HYZ26_13870 [Chloroflexi bacterium]|nr:hypothetical protein [Chloroflexota bacterium]